MRTTTTMAPAPAHLVSVTDAGTGYRAECSCGWASDRLDTLDGADLAGGKHSAEAVGPPDGMDRLMSGLLDLQDDLAAVVMWLAENWSVHLPELGWYATGCDTDTDRPAVRVLGYCLPDELIEAAALLGVAPVDDPDDGPHHTLYRRATRRFGRVEIQVYAKRDLAREHTP